MAVTTARPRPRELTDWMIAHGHTAATTPQVADWLGIPAGQVRMAMARLTRDRRIFSPARGLWIPIPPQYRAWGAPPAIEFVDDLMTHLGRAYYVGWLSAADLHGVAHQRPQVFQVAVDAPIANRSAGRVRLQFLTRGRAGELPTEARPTSGGNARVATPELVALDLADDPDAGGGLNNVATVLAGLAEEPGLDASRLIQLAAEFPAATGRRLGWLLDHTDAPGDRSPLLEHVRARAEHTPSRLSPHGPRRGGVDARWGVWVNTDVEPDELHGDRTPRPLARRARTSRPTLSAYEHGRKSPTLATAERLLAEAGYELTAEPRVTFTERSGRRGRLVAVPDRLPRLPVHEALATVTLQLHLNWSSPQRTFDLSDRRQRARLYEIVLREGGPDDIRTYIDGALFVDLWPELVLPRDVRAAWAPIVEAAA